MPAEFVGFLISKGADVNAEDARGGTPLYSVGSVRKAKMLIEDGANVNAGNSSGFTALFVTRSLEVAQLLIDHGADINARDKFGVTPLASVEQRLQVTRGQAGEPYRQSAEILRKHGATK